VLLNLRPSRWDKLAWTQALDLKNGYCHYNADRAARHQVTCRIVILGKKTGDRFF